MDDVTQYSNIEDMKVLYNQTSIRLYWYRTLPPSQSFFHHVQVSLYPDFRSFVYQDNSLGQDPTTLLTDSAANDRKRYWRWRTTRTVGGDIIENWSEVASYWLDTNATQEISVQRGDWILFDPDAVTDLYTLDLQPVYTIVDKNLYRFNKRNQRGDTKIEILNAKADIQLMFEGKQYIAHAQADEFRRFHNTRRTFFLAANKNGILKYAPYFVDKIYSRPAPHIWKVQFAQDPNFSMMAAGRPDLLTGAVQLTEV